MREKILAVTLVTLLSILAQSSLAGIAENILTTVESHENRQNTSGVFERTLSNGLKVIVKPDNRSPVVISQVWYKVGSSYETGGTTGVSHVLEHMMFKGSKKYPNDAYNKIIARNGGEDNAFTSRDYTAYYQKFEKSRLKISFELEADRMRNLMLPLEAFEKERMVVMEERRWRTDDKPQALTYEQFNALAFNNSGYHHPIIGWMNDLENLTIDDVKKWYEQYYAPNNATLVVVGDVDPEAVFELAKTYFGPLQPFEVAAAKPRVEHPQKGERRVVMKLEANLPYLVMGYKVPVINTAEESWEPYALDVLAGILDSGDSTRLSKNLVRTQKIAAQAGAGYSMDSRMQTLFTLDAVPANNASVEALEAALHAEVERLKNEPVSIEELDRVKAQVIASAVFEKDSMFYQAMKIGIAETTGVGWRADEQYVEKVQAITPEQLQQVARKYLVETGLTTAILEPLKKQDGNSDTGRKG